MSLYFCSHTTLLNDYLLIYYSKQWRSQLWRLLAHVWVNCAGMFGSLVLIDKALVQLGYKIASPYKILVLHDHHYNDLSIANIFSKVIFQATL